MGKLGDVIATYCKVDRASDTNKQYRLMLMKMANFVGVERPLRRVKLADLIEFVAELEVSATTKMHYVTVMRGFYKWCVESDYIKDSPAQNLKVRKPPKQDMENKAVPAHELRAMADYLRMTSKRNYAIFLFMVATGVRIGGVASMRLSLLNLDNMSAWIVKKGSDMQEVYFAEDVRDAICEWLTVRPLVNHDYIWTGQAPYAPYQARSISEMIRVTSVAVETSKPWRGHAIRHSFGEAQTELQTPINVIMALMGHSNIKMTERYQKGNRAYLRRVAQHTSLAAMYVDQIQPDMPIRVLPKTGT